MRDSSYQVRGSNHRRPLPVFIFFFIFLCMLTPAFAAPGETKANNDRGAQQTGTEGETQVPESDPEMAAAEARLAEIEGQLAELGKLEVAAQEGTTELPLQGVQDRLGAVRKIQAALQQYLGALREYNDLEERLAESTASLGRFHQLEEPPPYTLAFLDPLIDAIKARRMDVEAEEVSLNALKERADIERGEIADAKANLNRAQESLRTASDAERPAITFSVDTARLLLEAAEAEARAAIFEFLAGVG